MRRHESVSSVIGFETSATSTSARRRPYEQVRQRRPILGINTGMKLSSSEIFVSTMLLRFFARMDCSPNASNQGGSSPPMDCPGSSRLSLLRGRRYILEVNAVSPQKFEPSPKRGFCSPPLSCTTGLHNMVGAFTQRLRPQTTCASGREGAKRK